MKSITLVGATIAAVSMFAMPMAATAGGGSTTYKTCQPGSPCHPGKPVEKVVPHYYPVPTKSQHVYYDTPPAQPVTTRIIHHVPTPIYGQTHIKEVVNGGQWTGPALNSCCKPKVRTSYCYKRPKRSYGCH